MLLHLKILCVESYLVSSTIETNGVPASLLMSDARCPALTLIFSTQFAGKKKSAVELTADVAGSTILTRTPPVDDTEPGKLSDSSFQPRRSRTRRRALSPMLDKLANSYLRYWICIWHGLRLPAFRQGREPANDRSKHRGGRTLSAQKTPSQTG